MPTDPELIILTEEDFSKIYDELSGARANQGMLQNSKVTSDNKQLKVVFGRPIYWNPVSLVAQFLPGYKYANPELAYKQQKLKEM